MPNTYADATLALQALAGAGFRDVYVQRGDASGDIPHILSALAVKAAYGVLVVDGTDTGTKGSRMADSYHTSNHIAQNRIGYVKNDLLTVSKAVDDVPARAGGARTWELTQSTKDAVAALLSPDKEAAKRSRVAMREVLRGGKYDVPGAEDDLDADDEALREVLTAYEIPLKQNVVVLWGRRSGKLGGLYPELDASTTGLVQLAAECRAQGWTVLIAGAVPPAKSARFAPGTIYLGEFWNDPLWKEKWGDSRQKQVRLFYILKRELKANKNRLVHVGMRSGGLDAYGFAGQAIVYIVAEYSPDKRMAPKVQQLKSAEVLEFDRFEAERTPKRFGALKEDPEWTAKFGKKDAVEKYQAIKTARRDLANFPANLPQHLRKEAEAAYQQQVLKRGFSAGDLRDLVALIRAKLVQPVAEVAL
jgi:hypothetical protein